MATKSNRKSDELISLYSKEYKARYGRVPVLNRYKERWNFADMIEDLGEEDAKRVIEYYFKTGTTGHPLIELFKRYDRLFVAMSESEEDDVERERLRRETKERVEAWRKRYEQGT